MTSDLSQTERQGENGRGIVPVGPGREETLVEGMGAVVDQMIA